MAAQYGMTGGLSSFGGGGLGGLAGDAVAGVEGYNRAMAQLNAIYNLRKERMMDPFRMRAEQAALNNKFFGNAIDAQRGADEYAGELYNHRVPMQPGNGVYMGNTLGADFTPDMRSFWQKLTGQEQQDPSLENAPQLNNSAAPSMYDQMGVNPLDGVPMYNNGVA